MPKPIVTVQLQVRVAADLHLQDVMNRVQQNFGATEKSFPVKLDDDEAQK